MNVSDATNFAEVADALDVLHGSGQDLSKILSAPCFDEFINSETFKQAQDLLISGSYSARDNAAIYNEIKSLLVGKDGNWFAGISVSETPTDYICSIPHKTMMCDVSPSPETAPIVTTYEVHGPIEDLSQTNELRLENPNSITLGPDVGITLESGWHAIQFRKRGPRHIILGLMHRDSAQYTHSFDQVTERCISGSFASENVNAYYYFSEIGADFSANASLLNSFSSSEREDFENFLDRHAADPSLPVEIRWTFLQGLARLSPSRLPPRLKELAECPNQAIAALSRKSLSALASRGLR